MRNALITIAVCVCLGFVLGYFNWTPPMGGGISQAASAILGAFLGLAMGAVLALFVAVMTIIAWIFND